MCKQYVTDWYATSKANCREDVGGCGMFFPQILLPTSCNLRHCEIYFCDILRNYFHEKYWSKSGKSFKEIKKKLVC